MKFSMYFCKKNLSREHPLSVFPNPTNTYITILQEKHKGALTNSPAAEVNQQRGSMLERKDKYLSL